MSERELNEQAGSAGAGTMRDTTGRIGTPQEMQVWLGEQRERIRELERELLVRVGVCRNRVCELHRDHVGACRIPGYQDVSSDLV